MNRPGFECGTFTIGVFLVFVNIRCMPGSLYTCFMAQCHGSTANLSYAEIDEQICMIVRKAFLVHGVLVASLIVVALPLHKVYFHI